jgi:hypothetical protein
MTVTYGPSSQEFPRNRALRAAPTPPQAHSSDPSDQTFGPSLHLGRSRGEKAATEARSSSSDVAG